MPKQRVENDVIYNGKRRLQDLDTGEIFEVDDIVKKTPRNGFMITYLTAIIQLIDTLGNKKMQVVKYILANMDKSTNTLIITTRELSEKSEVSIKTVVETLKTLEQAQIITRRTGAIMMHPSLVHRGKDSKEKYLLARFRDFNNDKTPINDIE
ncbi:replication/maintenance protein RepL [Bacillus thuringiensis]|uniref:replication/maintenance protein RepL n=1 Tax=Bacillus thuringiensis TaxID=1428 RepID=UPI0026E17FC6|nr:replication/maintenance protein RepL [Bacillus thuringiensis]MDO6634326.1 replication/maintenance protein RepL [Bacillus thuringiensis]MDO6663566.1 replication/maintenance protein RepL [Bacillus thuringiensis]MDO6704479.1 replication/maintenance protein RepL [Bacillus thuringiensis]